MKTAVQIIIEYINNLRMKGEKNLLLKSWLSVFNG
jgi:hypothetical protein